MDHTIVATSASQVAVRLAADRDAEELGRLAALDGAPVPAGPALIAEIDGEVVAALPITGAPAVANPFRRTAAAVELLELRAAQIRGHVHAASGSGSHIRRVRTLIRMPRALPLR